MTESPKRFFFIFCLILGLLLMALSAGGWYTFRQMGPSAVSLSGLPQAEDRD